MPNVKPDIMRWARETSGLSTDEAARKLGLRQAHGMNPVERLRALEVGDAEPARPMLSKMAAVYRRPLLTFYLARPPIVVTRGEDFRTLPDEPHPGDEAVLDALIRNVRARQAMVRNVLEDDEELEPLAFVGSRTLEDGVDAVRDSIAQVLGISLTEYRKSRDIASAFGLLREAAEDAGVFVLLTGDLGSYHTALDTASFRGFALSDDVAPFVVLNPLDAKSALSFTLLHELAHLWLGVTGISGSGDPEFSIDRFCNDVASTYLVPEHELETLSIAPGQELEDLANEVALFARERKVSASMVAYRLHRAHAIGVPLWQRLRAYYRNRWLESRQAARDRARVTTGGPSYYTLRRHQAGRALVDLVRRNLRGGAFTTTEAGTVIGVGPKSVDGVLA